MTPTIELLLDCRATIGESPTWFAAEGALFWIDVKEPALHRLAADGRRSRWPVEADIGAFALLEGAVGAVIALRSGLFRLDFATGALSLLAESPFDPRLFRFNEGICDARGRFWVGVMFDPLPQTRVSGSQSGALHRFTLASGLIAAADEAELHNGFAWNEQNDAFFWSHSRAHQIFRAPYDLSTGVLGPAEPFARTGAGGPVPDGAAMDVEGCYWCAIHGAGALHRYDGTGRLIAQIALPVSQPTMCAFIGRDLDELVVTSARDELSATRLAGEPYAGGLFRLRPGVRGLPRPCVVQ